MFMIVVIPNAFRTAPTCLMAGWSSGANMNTMPASSSTSPMRRGERSIPTPRASRTSALPERDVNDRFPCLATGTPAPAVTIAAAVEMLNVVTLPPPVPAVSTSAEGSEAGTGTIAFRSARTPPAISLAATPFALSPTSKPAIWASEAEPSMNRSKAASAASALRAPPSATVFSASRRSPTVSVELML